MKITAVAFDVDGTLYPNASMYFRSIPFALSHLKLIKAYRQVRREIRDLRPVEDFQRTEEELLAKRLSVSPDEARLLIAKDIHEEWESVLDRVPPYPYVRECVESITGRGLAVAVASDFPVDRKLERLGFSDLFECRIWSEQTGYLKPHPEPFQEIARCFDCSVDSILYVGNSYEYDVVGGHDAGMKTAHLSRRAPAGSVADFTFSDYRELTRWVQNNS